MAKKDTDYKFLCHLDGYLNTVDDSYDMLDVVNNTQTAIERQLKLDKVNRNLDKLNKN